MRRALFLSYKPQQSLRTAFNNGWLRTIGTNNIDVRQRQGVAREFELDCCLTVDDRWIKSKLWPQDQLGAR